MIKANSFKDLINYFSTDTRPVTTPEFTSFWKSCDDVAKDYFKWVDLSTGRFIPEAERSVA